jgi:hypothetical protein
VLKSKLQIGVGRAGEALQGRATFESPIEGAGELTMSLPRNVCDDVLTTLKVTVQRRRGDPYLLRELPHGEAVEAILQVQLAGAGQDLVSLF